MLNSRNKIISVKMDIDLVRFSALYLFMPCIDLVLSVSALKSPVIGLGWGVVNTKHFCPGV